MTLHQHEIALKDARKAVDLDRSFVKQYLRTAKRSSSFGEV
jgi:hypothetical protein